MIISQITYGASVWHRPTGEKKKQNFLVLQIAQAQALGARLILGAFKATLANVSNIEVYLTSIDFGLDKKPDQTAACLNSGLLYHILI